LHELLVATRVDLGASLFLGHLNICSEAGFPNSLGPGSLKSKEIVIDHRPKIAISPYRAMGKIVKSP
jgi:hypothetical protein